MLEALKGASRKLRFSKPLSCCAAGLVTSTVSVWANAEALQSSKLRQVCFGKLCAIAFSFNVMAGRLNQSTKKGK
jgi:hypothetical protein